MMTANLLKHRIEPDESLAAIAQHHHLPGWQALYFWEGNRDFRTQCPDPWHPDANAVLTIPEIPFHAGALRDTLNARLRLLEQVRRECRRLLNRQAAMLRDCARPPGIPVPPIGDPPAPTQPAGNETAHPPMPHRLTAVLAETTLDAIQLLKAKDSGMSRANWGLAKAALSRRPPVDAASSTEMLTLLGRAADGVIWGIPGQPARAWCDARDPLFWGKGLKVAVSATSDAGHLCPMLESANRQAGDAVLRILDSLHVEALDEAAQLERSMQSIHESPEESGI